MKLIKRIKWQGYVLAGITIAAFLLYLWNINGEGYSNAYYAAAVKSMTESPKAFFFGSLDTGLYVTVDKPPLGLMIQALSALVFGVNSFGIIFPSALSGVGCIILVYFMVKRPWGPTAGVIASGVMAFTPIIAALSRTNNLDMILLFFMTCGAFFILKAADKQSLKYYILAMVFLGLGFNVKMLEAYLALPAFIVVYFAAKGRIVKKILHSLIAVAVLLAVSLSWAVVVDSIPAFERPYIGGSGDNSVIDLTLGYNGIERLNGMGTFQDGLNRSDGQRKGNGPFSSGFNREGDSFRQDGGHNGEDYRKDREMNSETPPNGYRGDGYQNGEGNPRGNPGGSPGGFQGGDGNFGGFSGGNRGGMSWGPGGEQESGKKGVLRLYTTQLSGLVSWFLLPAIGMAVIAGAGFLCLIFGRRKKADNKILSKAGTDTKSRIWRVQEWDDERRRKLTNIIFWSVWLLTMGIFFSIGGFIHRYYVGILSPSIAALSAAAAVAAWKNKYSKWIVPVLLTASLAVQCVIAGTTVWSWILIPMAAVGVAAIVLFQFKAEALKMLSAMLMAAAMFIAPIAWSLTPVIYNLSATIPDAGPSAQSSFKSGGVRMSVDSKLSEFLVSNYNGERWAVAVPNAQDAEAIILATGLPVMAVSGFSGDNIMTLDELKQYVADGKLKYFIISGMFGGFSEISQWVSKNAKIVSVAPSVMVYDLTQKSS